MYLLRVMKKYNNDPLRNKKEEQRKSSYEFILPTWLT